MEITNFSYEIDSGTSIAELSDLLNRRIPDAANFLVQEAERTTQDFTKVKVLLSFQFDSAEKPKL